MTTTAELYGVSEKQWQQLQQAYANHRAGHAIGTPFTQCAMDNCVKHSKAARWKLISAKNAGKLARFPVSYAEKRTTAADMTTNEATPLLIARFRGAFFYLSNFFPVDIPYDSTLYRSVEYAYQAAKTTDPDWKRRIQQAATPGEAKRLGRQAPLDPSFEANKFSVMRVLVALKFAQGTELARYLVSTGQATLVEGNMWHDTYWGQCDCDGCGGKGENMLGKLLMEQRERLQ